MKSKEREIPYGCELLVKEIYKPLQITCLAAFARREPKSHVELVSPASCMIRQNRQLDWRAEEIEPAA